MGKPAKTNEGAVSKKASKKVRVYWRDKENRSPIVVNIEGKREFLTPGEVYDLPLYTISLLKNKKIPRRRTMDGIDIKEKARKMNTSATWNAGGKIADEFLFFVEEV